MIVDSRIAINFSLGLILAESVSVDRSRAFQLSTRFARYHNIGIASEFVGAIVR
jgi:hypothetical protein